MLRIALWMILTAALAMTAQAQGAATAAPDASTPHGWRPTGSNPEAYEFAADTKVKRGGRASGTIKAKPTAEKGKFGSLGQSIRADDYRGKRIRLSGFMRTENVEENAQFWLRVDGPGLEVLDFSNMDERPAIKGTTDWMRYELVVDVPHNAAAIIWGAFLTGAAGQIWIDDLKLEAVGADVATTSNKVPAEARADVDKQFQDYLKSLGKEEVDRRIAAMRTRPLKPVNMDFEETSPTSKADGKSR